MNNVNAAVELFRDKCACSQAIFATYGPSWGVDHDQALKIAAGFGGGMRLGEVCGAVTGAFMVLGLARCDSKCNKPEGRIKVSEDVKTFVLEFKKRNGTVLCREILGCDISTPEGMKTAQEKGLFSTTCEKIVKDAAEILEGMLQLS